MAQLIHRRVWFNNATPSEVVGTDVDCAGSFAIGCRFKTDKLKNVIQTLINKEDAGVALNENYHLRIDSTGVLVGFFGTGAALIAVTGNTKVTDGIWHFAVLVHDITGQTLNIYLDGMRDAAPTATGGVAPLTNAALLRLGRWPGTALSFNGHMSDAFIYNRALSEAEINYNYRHSNNPIRRGLQVSYTQDSIDQPAAGTWQDRSGNARNGTITNATTSKYPAIRGGANALFFRSNPLTDKVDCGNGASLNPALTGLISVEAWVKANFILSGTWRVIAQKISGAAGWQLGWSHISGMLYFQVFNDGNAIRSVAGLNLKDKWIHVVATYTSGAATGKIYVNGVDVTLGSNAVALGNSVTNLLVGGDGTAPVDGYMASCRVYNRILSAQEVAYNYQRPNNPIKRGRVLDLSPESLYGSQWQDLSGNANNGTITGAVAKNLGLLTGR